MTAFYFWSVVGFILGAIVGSLATDLTREDYWSGDFRPTRHFWKVRQQSLAVVGGLWVFLLVLAAVSLWLGAPAWLQGLLAGSVIGAVAAPWLWLHFVRSFGAGTKGLAAWQKLIEARAHEIWLEEGQPQGRGLEFYYKAEKEIAEAEQSIIETSAKFAEQQLVRYQLLCILLGVALLVVTVLPYLKTWLPRTQQFGFYGLSLTFVSTQPSSQSQGTPLVNQEFLLGAENGSDRVSDAIKTAANIGAAKRHPPVASLDQIGPDLNGFDYLSLFDRDRAYIAWLTYELPENRPPSGNLSLIDYIKGAEALLQHSIPAKWADPTLDRDFVARSSIISDCLLREESKPPELSDPHFFYDTASHYMHTFLFQIYAGRPSGQIKPQFSFPGYLGVPSEPSGRESVCDSDSIWPEEQSLSPIQLRGGDSTCLPILAWVSPYPSLVAAYYFAAVGSVDTGVRVLEDWIRCFKKHHDRLTPESEPQLGWYLLRAKWNASAMPFQFADLVVPHLQLVKWQLDETDQFGKMLGIGDADRWKRLCNRLERRHATLHKELGRRLAFYYATERFYLFERLTSEDFKIKNELDLGSLADYLQEAEAIRDTQYCINQVPFYLNSPKEYESYFKLYTAELRVIARALESDAERGKESRDAIEHELEEADHFGTAATPYSLLARSDIWEKHRVRLKLLKAQLEDEGNR